MLTHILNLVAKSILRQFDMPKKTGANDRMDLDDAATALAGLAQELEELSELEDNDPDDEEADDEMPGDNNEDFGDERDGMSEVEVAELENSLIPIQIMLTKVSIIYYLI
jgi:hypothetical protein